MDWMLRAAYNGGVAGYTQENGTEVAFSAKQAERVSGEQIYPEGYGKYGKSVGYRVDLTLYWKYKEAKN